MANKSNDFFPQRPESKPIIYAYSDPTYPGMLKVGYTTRTVEERMHEHYPTLRPGTAEPYKVELVDSAMYCDGGSFLDHDVHRVLEKKGFKAIKDREDKKTEWFNCSIDDIQSAIVAVKNHTENVENRTQSFSMRPEQMRAVEKTSLYFESAKKEQPNKAAKFLWNAKMRFGKTFTSYQLAKKMGFSKVLILTFKPAVQSAFRVQTPWEVHSEGDNSKSIIVKQECYVFDFALNRALKQISDYARNLNADGGNPENKVAEFIKFLPVLAYDGSSMRQVDAGEILDIAMSGTTATMLAKRWESALLVNVDNDTLKKLLMNKEALEAVNKIVGFRSLNNEIETIINKSESIKKTKTEKEERLTPTEAKELSDEEKEIKSMRKQIQEKLIKFATRIPVFMYLSDFREYCLRDVIQELEPELFKRVTGLTVKDFNLLVSLNVFNETLMNDAVYKFKRYEDASLSYTGIDKHAGEGVGLYSTVLSRADYDSLSGKTGEG